MLPSPMQKILWPMIVLSSHPVSSLWLTPSFRRTPTLLPVHNTREFDPMGEIIGGVRYSLVPMPDAMKETTAYVGNLCEFVHDEDLSSLFAQVSNLLTVPSCVVRKIDTTSLRYGFVAFPTVQEKEAAIIRFDGFEWRGKRLKVDSIRDHPKSGRVRIPESLVDYVYGQRATSPVPAKRKQQQRKPTSNSSQKQRIPASKHKPQHRDDTVDLARALRRGYATLASSSQSSLCRLHRQYSDQMGQPQIVLRKGKGSNPVDRVVVDVSPLRMHAMLGDVAAEECMVKRKVDILNAALTAGMDRIAEEDDDAMLWSICGNQTSTTTLVFTLDEKVPTAQTRGKSPIDKLPVVHCGGVFEGERTKAKHMASSLAKLWGIPALVGDDIERRVSGSSDSHRKFKRRDRKRHSGHKRKRGGGHRQAWF